MANNRLVYSTESGRIKPGKETPTQRIEGDGIVRIRRETKGRKGKGMTIIEGLPLDEAPLKALTKELKKVCGTGGTLKAQTIEIQGDHREKLKQHLEAKGYVVKLAGG